MKKLGKILLILLLIPYVAAVIFLTVCLLNYNKYNVTELGKKTFVIIDEEMGKYQEGDLVIVNKNKAKDIKVGDYVFFYDVKARENVINYGEVKEKQGKDDKDSIFLMEGNYQLSIEHVIGKEGTSKVYHDLGKVLSILESRWGFLFFVIFPVLLIFIYEIYMFIVELKRSPKES